MMPAQVREAERFAVELAQETGCEIADVSCAKFIPSDELLIELSDAEYNRLLEQARGLLSLNHATGENHVVPNNPIAAESR